MFFYLFLSNKLAIFSGWRLFCENQLGKFKLDSLGNDKLSKVLIVMHKPVYDCNEVGKFKVSVTRLNFMTKNWRHS